VGLLDCTNIDKNFSSVDIVVEASFMMMNQVVLIMTKSPKE